MSEEPRPWSDNLIVVRLPAEPQTADELNTLTNMLENGAEHDILLDFAEVQQLRQYSLCRIVGLQWLQERYSRRIAFCNVCSEIREQLEKHRLEPFIDAAWDTETNRGFAVNQDPKAGAGSGRQIRHKTPERRRYSRLNLSKSMRTTGLLRLHSSEKAQQAQASEKWWQCRLVDITLDGAQIVIDTHREPDFHKGQPIILRFSPIACELPIDYDAEIRGVLPSVDAKHLCLGVKFVGLEANINGRRSLQRLCDSKGRNFEKLVQSDDLDLTST